MFACLAFALSVTCLHSKEVLKMKAGLLSECRARMKFGDDGDYSSILGRLKKHSEDLRISPPTYTGDCVQD